MQLNIDLVKTFLVFIRNW